MTDWKTRQMIKASGWPLEPDTLAPGTDFSAPQADGLVPLHSALGVHDDVARQLVFAPEHQRIVYRTNHMQLLSSPLVTQQLLDWLRPKTAS